MKIDWRNVLARRDDLVGKHATLVEGSLMCVGLLKGIWGTNDTVQLVFPWMAWFGRETGTWHFINIRVRVVSRSVPVFVEGDERVRFEIPGVAGVSPSPFTLGEPNFNAPNPKEINGLPDRWERLLAWYPNLAFDCDTVNKTFDFMGKRHGRDRASLQLSPKTTMEHVLATLTDIDAKEKFLQRYILFATNEDVRGTLY